MSTNILNGDLDTLENIIVDVNSYSLSARKHEEILDEIDNLGAVKIRVRSLLAAMNQEERRSKKRTDR